MLSEPSTPGTPSRPVVDPEIPFVRPLLVAAALVALAAGLLGTFTRGDLGRAAGGVAVVAIVAAPLLRVLLLAVVWWRRHDRRYSLAAVGLLMVVGAGAVIAVLR